MKDMFIRNWLKHLYIYIFLVSDMDTRKKVIQGVGIIVTLSGCAVTTQVEILLW